jgi:hypothetical protein
MPADPLSPSRLYSAVVFEEARDLVGKLLAEPDPDVLADLIEHAVDKSDRAHAVIFMLVASARDWPMESGVEIANKAPTAGKLILP